MTGLGVAIAQQGQRLIFLNVFLQQIGVPFPQSRRWLPLAASRRVAGCRSRASPSPRSWPPLRPT